MIFDSFLNSAVKNLSDSIPVTKLMGVGSSPVQGSSAPLMSLGNNYSGISPAPISPLQASQPGFLSFLNPNNMGDAGLPGLGFQMPNFGGLFNSQSMYSGIEGLPTNNGNKLASPTSTGQSDQSGPGISTPPSTSSVPTSPNNGTTTTTPAAPSSASSNGIVSAASRQLGQPYVWGGTGANSGGFDCSGLTQWAYAQNGINLPRTAQEQYNATKRIPLNQLQPGDLVFFANTYASSEPITHVGIYIGNGKMINAPSEGQNVQTLDMNNSYWASHFAGGGRV